MLAGDGQVAGHGPGQVAWEAAAVAVGGGAVPARRAGGQQLPDHPVLHQAHPERGLPFVVPAEGTASIGVEDRGTGVGGGAELYSAPFAERDHPIATGNGADAELELAEEGLAGEGLAESTEIAGLMSDVLVASIGPVTSDTARERGLEVGVQPEEYTIPGLVDAIVEYYAE